MTPPRTLTGSFARLRWVSSPAVRRIVFAVLILVFLALALFPERYRAAVTLTPSDPTTLGFNPTQVQFGALNSVFGNQAAVEIALKVAASVQVRDRVATQLKLQDRLDLSQPRRDPSLAGRETSTFARFAAGSSRSRPSSAMPPSPRRSSALTRKPRASNWARSTAARPPTSSRC